jgi:hypothetical protein
MWKAPKHMVGLSAEAREHLHALIRMRKSSGNG